MEGSTYSAVGPFIRQSVGKSMQAIGTEEVMALRQQTTWQFQEQKGGTSSWTRVNKEDVGDEVERKAS